MRYEGDEAETRGESLRQAVPREPSVGLSFPIVIKRSGTDAPNASLYYEVAENGVFQVRDTPLYRAVSPVDSGVPGLLPETPHVEIRFRRLPRAQVQEVLAFFADVYRRYRGEAVVILFYRHAAQEFRVGVPPQVLRGRQQSGGWWRADLGVTYGTVERPDGFVRLGTIHSHADLPAYASHVDCADEQFGDGLHVVFGDFHKPELSIAAAFVANGTRFAVVPADVLEPAIVPARSARTEWMAQVKPTNYVPMTTPARTGSAWRYESLPTRGRRGRDERD